MISNMYLLLYPLIILLIFTMATKPHHDAETEAIQKAPDEGEYIFGPRGFNIVWGNDSRYWRLPPPRLSSSHSNNNNNNEVAELVQVSWLEVTGSVQLKDTASYYKITFELSFKGDASGWSNCPVFLMAKVGKKGKYKWRKLKEMENNNLPKEPKEFPSSNDPFIVEVPNDALDTRLYFGLYEVWSGKWKKGLKVHKAIVKKIEQTNNT